MIGITVHLPCGCQKSATLEGVAFGSLCLPFIANYMLVHMWYVLWKIDGLNLQYP